MSLEELKNFDYIVVVDASGSMTTEDVGGKSRWEHMQETLGAFARDLNKMDSDGLGLVVFSGTGIDSYDNVLPDKIDQILKGRNPRSSTPMAEALSAALKMAGKSDKKDFIIVFTDGVPDNKEAVADVIRAQANSQAADDECTILFVQVGYDSAATAYLKMLDDDLAGAKFDIVDAKTISEAEKFASTAELVIAAIND